MAKMCRIPKYKFLEILVSKFITFLGQKSTEKTDFTAKNGFSITLDANVILIHSRCMAKKCGICKYKFLEILAGKFIYILSQKSTPR
jgi:hypothetical protein